MKTLKQIQNQLFLGQFEFSYNAFKSAIERKISETEISEAGEHAIIIEDYPDDKFSPSCLLLGFTKNRKPIHIQVSLIDSEFVKIITLYQPSNLKWTENYAQRR